MFDFVRRTDLGVAKSRQQWFRRIAGLFSRGRISEDIWNQLEELLISADVGVTTTSRLMEQVKKRAKEQNTQDGPQICDLLKQEMVSLLNTAHAPTTVQDSPGNTMRLVLVVGVNGSGKTTSIAKLANYYRGSGATVILGAADTFRAAAIEQLKLWGKRAGVDVIAHQPGSDPGAVVFDTIQAAHARHASTVIIDTAGRLHTKFNLMEELKKIQRAAMKTGHNLEQQVLLVIDATTGQNGLSQARHFTQAVGVDGIFLSKLDGTARGGIALTICDELKIPILYIGTGEQLEDIAPFDPRTFVEALFADR